MTTGNVTDNSAELEELLALLLEEEGISVEAAQGIRRRGGSEQMPLSFAQRRLWFIDQLEPGLPLYNVPSAARLKGPLDISALKRSLDEIVRRHEVLRTSLVADGDEPVQVVRPACGLSLPLDDLSALPEDERETEARRMALVEAKRPFDFERDLMLRARLIRLSEEEHILSLTMHHVASDGWSGSLLYREISALYTAYSEGGESPLPELPIQYSDYAAWQRECLQGGEEARQLAYWKRQLAGAPALLELPTDRPRPPVQTFRGVYHNFRFAPELVAGLEALSRAEGATLFMTLMAAFNVVLSRYAHQQDICVGTPIAGRTRPETESLIGFFVNTLVLRTDLSGDPTFRELLRRVREATLDAHASQDVPFERLVEELQPERSLSYTPLFQVMFAMQNQHNEELQLPGVKISRGIVNSETSKFDVTLMYSEKNDGHYGTLVYNSALFEQETIGRMEGHLKTLLRAVVDDPSRRLGELEWLTEAERRQLLLSFGGPAPTTIPDTCVHEQFEAQAARTPEAVAVAFGDRRLTYAELNARASSLARRLGALGVGPDSLVGVCVGRSPDMLVALLGVLKAGGAYVPLDPTYPKDRVAFMLEDSKAAVLVTERGLLPLTPEHSARVICVDELEVEAGEEAAAGVVSQENLAYVIYTSGSTGTPKGVAVTHRSLSNFLASMRARPGLSAADTLLALTTPCFDIAALELFLPLVTGARVAVASREEAADATALARAVEESGASVVQATPATWRMLVESGWEGRAGLKVLCGGEALEANLARELCARAGEVWNMYGPTETTIWSGAVRVGAEALKGARGTAPVGGPVANTKLYVLDAGLRPVAVGVAGELYIGGDGLARGYLNRPALTAERFVPDPFASEPGARLYRTGDSVRWLADGRVEFIGRLDHQVKVRGYRIELGEVESALRTLAQVVDAVAVVREDEPGDKRLVAYVVSEGGADAGALRAHLKERLPEYMIPSAFVALDSLPLTPNGKVDKKALPAPGLANAGGEGGYVAPRTQVEAALAELWRELLKVERVGVEDNFFELGGHSLLATQLIFRVRKAFKTEVSLFALFESPTVAALAVHVEAGLAGSRGTFEPAAEAEKSGVVLSPAQERVWFLEQLQPNSFAFNLPAAYRVTGALDAGALARSAGEVVRRHEVLRAGFRAVEGQAEQFVAPAGEFAVNVIDLCEVPEGEREAEARRVAAEESRRPFDLGRPPLLRVTLIRTGEEAHVLLLVMHHIASDGRSVELFVRELFTIYGAYTRGEESPLAGLPIQYADHAAWQRGREGDEEAVRELEYWKGRLAGAPPVVELPAERPRPARLTFDGARHTAHLSQELTRALRELSDAEGVTLFETLLAALSLLLKARGAGDDIVLGTEAAGRVRPGTESLIGFFTNQLALRTSLSGDPTVGELLRRARGADAEARGHQGVPFERVVEELQPRRDPSRTPLFQVRLVTAEAPWETEAAGLRVRRLELEDGPTRFDVTVFAAEEGGRLSLTWEYNTELYTRGGVARAAEQFVRILDAVARGGGQRVGGLLEELAEAEAGVRERAARAARESGRERLKALKRRKAE